MVIVNIKVYKRNIWNVTMWPVCKYLQYIYINISMYVCMYMYMYARKRMSCIYSMSSAKAGSGCKTALAAAGPPVSAWSTPWYHITIWARMFASHASLPASSDMKPRGQWRPKGPWEKKRFFGEEKLVTPTRNRRELTYTPPGGSMWDKKREWELPKRNDSRNHSRKYSRELWEVTSLNARGTVIFSGWHTANPTWTFSKAQSSKLKRLFFRLWNSIRKCHPKWDWLYIPKSSTKSQPTNQPTWTIENRNVWNFWSKKNGFGRPKPTKRQQNFATVEVKPSVHEHFQPRIKRHNRPPPWIM